jgi:glutamate synthase domain-containing protein 2
MDIVGPEDLGMKINQLRDITDWKIPIMVKFTSGRVEQDVKIAAKAGADIIVVDGMQGGTGAGPEVVTEHSGIPTIQAILEADNALRDINMRTEVSLVAAGGIRSGADVAKAIALGADAAYIGTAALISLGCKVCQGCSKGTCPKGIATQDRLFRRRLDPVRGGEHVANYIKVMTEEAKMLTQQAKRVKGVVPLSLLMRNSTELNWLASQSLCMCQRLHLLALSGVLQSSLLLVY